ncbi:hypothetical protein [Pseudomonas aeruginosa]|uniref:hypothetical protein n=1 Tax=Pseudomonas aeruginosa TaxID=287 RepID=UPI0015F023DE|nr:hypothetical protein [Pseudomonas aeruginosa]MBA4994327.1 hypothetical protein [Pseudomonas aeruginosa]HEO1760179.1 hypothetical protein [Pseudomonas aeruginosa]
MKPEMSEFSYGFAFTNELITSPGSHVVAAPEFPSLQKEGKPGGGYDVKIPFGSPLFLQFKLSHYLERTNCKEYTLMGGAYYRWHLHALRHSAQHDLLLELESKGNEVYYVAPGFHQTAELNAHYLSKQIVNRSFGFRPGDIGVLPDEDEHYVVFNSRPLAYRCSDEPSPVKAQVMGDLLGVARDQRATRNLNEAGIRQIGQTIVDVLRKSRTRRSLVGHKSINPDEVARAIDNQPTLRTLAFISRTVLDSELLILRNEPAVNASVVSGDE